MSDTQESLDHDRKDVPGHLHWVLENKAEILKIHSSEGYTNIFTQYVSHHPPFKPP
jgi:hypothetical protein